MKKISLTILCVFFNVSAYASPIQYQFVGNSLEPEIDFILQLDFSQDGFFIDNDGSLGNFDISRNTFLVNYISGNYSLVPSTSQRQSFYGEDLFTPEGVIGCVYTLNTIELCAEGGVSSWTVGWSVGLTLFDQNSYYQTSVRIESISAVPLPGSLVLFLSGITFLTVTRKNITSSLSGRKKRVA